MKITALLLIFVLTAGISYWVGFSKGKSEGFWQEFSSTLGFAHIFRSQNALNESGEELMHKFADIWIYGYFTTPGNWLSDEKKQEIEDLLVGLIEWKVDSGHQVGPKSL